MLSTPLGAAAQAAYSELLDVVRHLELSRSIETLSGSFNRKTVRGIVYWYYQFTEVDTGKLTQYFIGPDSDPLRALVERARAKDARSITRLAAAAIAHGCAGATPTHFRVVRRLNEVGFFRAGGLLIGTHAFLACGNALGVSWGEAARTQDLDFAHAGSNIELGLPHLMKVDTASAIERLEAGFLPIPGFRPWEKTASFVSKTDRSLRVDFLAPMVGGKEAPYEHAELGVRLQPLRFLEFILEDVGQAVVLSAVGATLVNVPDPARYALHKMLVYADRRARNPTKAGKDLLQSAALLEATFADREDDYKRLWKDLHARGAGWRARARKGFAALKKLAPELDALPMMDSIQRKFGPTPRKKPAARA
ncbi:GSU2403 family nucleotidyltransferase fold protein [Usitatibacter palustris]|uniref:Nucleotidyltransferase-like domain-containing protein n=1 Tax=Usitatibacter palustris TaxID=2732487 RepID=A0A6M4H1F3_9PROT|nr:GSU2403 family nucleotidyltransferase fold protein [Usitatibacter palustris]QJR13326.1 hypothetical protein DSM104440_00109 [Usitatibacter palustris]